MYYNSLPAKSTDMCYKRISFALLLSYVFVLGNSQVLPDPELIALVVSCYVYDQCWLACSYKLVERKCAIHCAVYG